MRMIFKTERGILQTLMNKYGGKVLDLKKAKEAFLKGDAIVFVMNKETAKKEKFQRNISVESSEEAAYCETEADIDKLSKTIGVSYKTWVKVDKSLSSTLV